MITYITLGGILGCLAAVVLGTALASKLL